MPFISLEMGPWKHKDYTFISQSRGTWQQTQCPNFHTRLGGGITACGVTVIDYCTCALCFEVTWIEMMGTVEEVALKLVIKELMDWYLTGWENKKLIDFKHDFINPSMNGSKIWNGDFF